MSIRYILDGWFDRQSVKGVNDNFLFLFSDIDYVKDNINVALTDLASHKKQNQQNFTFLFDSVGEVKTLSNNAKEALEEAKKYNEDNVNTNERLDNIIASSGTSDTEVVDARGDYSVLNQRLSSG